MVIAGNVCVRAIELKELQDHSILQPMASLRVAVTGEHPILAASIAEAMRANGCEVQVSNTPDSVTDVLVVTVALSDGEASEIHWRALEHVQAFRRAGGKSLILLQDTGGCFHGGPSHGWKGGMVGLARTAALEWPDMTVRCIDIAVDPDDIHGTTQRLISAFGSLLTVVGVDRSGKLFSMQAGERLTLPAQSSELEKTYGQTRANDVWLVSGGARGVTAACIEALAQRTSGRFALLGRSELAEWPANIEITDDITMLRRQLAANAIASGEKPVPKDIERGARQALAGQEIRDTLKKLHAVGASARYYPCDISDQQEVQQVVAQIQDELGQINALVHGAGVLADSLLVDKTQAQFNRVFETKVGGLQNLLDALGDTPLAYTALFSSAAAFYGNTGQSDYAMANEVLNRVAKSLKSRWPDATVRSFNWGPWDSGMVDQTLARYFEERGIALIPVREGAVLFADAMLSEDTSAIELLVGDSWAG